MDFEYTGAKIVVQEISKLLFSLSKGCVELVFKSHFSGDTKKILCTLKDYEVNQSPSNDYLVIFRMDTRTYEDIKADTIITWREV